MISSYIAADSVLPLTVALVVFIMLTVVLSAFVALVCASPRFRRFLFSKDEPNKAQEKEKDKDEQTEHERARNSDVKRARPSEKKRAATTRSSASQKRRKDPEFLVYTDSVPTVPLDMPIDDGEKTRSRGGKTGR